ncbi:MAG: hypothetical protein M1822_001303 [Bathelium mastoideum]|nr:MAG: hypothetical protein M1822_001303 [Bathelium mastoideum]
MAGESWVQIPGPTSDDEAKRRQAEYERKKEAHERLKATHKKEPGEGHQSSGKNSRQQTRGS